MKHSDDPFSGKVGSYHPVRVRISSTPPRARVYLVPKHAWTSKYRGSDASCLSDASAMSAYEIPPATTGPTGTVETTVEQKHYRAIFVWEGGRTTGKPFEVTDATNEVRGVLD
jgi:hypothetical protein